MSRTLELHSAIEKYKNDFGIYPTGDNAAIMKTLCGDNSKHEQLFLLNSRMTEHARNEKGQCVDGWETPFQINFSSTNSFVISSAGKDKIFGDADDIIFNSVSNAFVKP